MDGTLIEQVLINLLENAIKNSPEDTVVEVRLTAQKDKAVFEVLDRGRGILEEEFPYLFSSNKPSDWRSGDSSRGLGIGLSICRTIIKAHQGTLEAVNREGAGALFRFSLPLKGE